jgi:hypothetical protein
MVKTLDGQAIVFLALMGEGVPAIKRFRIFLILRRRQHGKA